MRTLRTLALLTPFLAGALYATDAAAACAPYDPSDGFGMPGAAPVSNPRHYTLREIGGCDNLVCWLDNVSGTDYANATLVIDQVCHLKETVRLPPRFVLAGVGMDGEGILGFTNLTTDQPAIRVASVGGAGNSTIRDLRIAGPGQPAIYGRGIELVDASQVILERVRISDFRMGIYGHSSYSIVVSQCSLHDNRVNIFMDELSNSWRVRDSIISRAATYGVFQTVSGGGANQNGSVFAGNRMEANLGGAMYITSLGTVIRDTYFELNGTAAPYVAVRTTPSASETKIIGNIFSSDVVNNTGALTECAFNINLFGACP
ncbi:MAG: right-handed parallel beta-helix repeat-containing protein [Deltaproteobacteria bacterium]|jgi:hypothetical protein